MNVNQALTIQSLVHLVQLIAYKHQLDTIMIYLHPQIIIVIFVHKVTIALLAQLTHININVHLEVTETYKVQLKVLTVVYVLLVIIALLKQLILSFVLLVTIAQRDLHMPHHALLVHLEHQKA